MSTSFSSQHSQSFPDFLSELGISVLVTTYQAGKLIHLRNENSVLNTHFLDMKKPMGMALQGPRLAIGTGNQVWDCYNMPDVAPKVEPINTHDACYLPRGLHITGDIDIHEMAFDQDDALWFVNTKMSCLCTLTSEHSVVPRWHPPFISEYDLTDRCHLNGLAMREGQPTYVTALGVTDTAGGWRKNKASGGIVMDINSNRVITSGLSMPHSPRWYQEKLWVLESGAGSLSTVDVDSGELTTIIELPGFTRGLDFMGRYALIGLSQVRETAVFAGLSLTEKCDERQCGVYIVDIVDKKMIGMVVFSGDVQEIFSVQILPARFPVVLSFDDPLLSSSYSLPDDALKKIGKCSSEQKTLEQANILLQSGNVKEAIQVYKGLLKEKPNNTQARLHLGMSYLSTYLWIKAIEMFQSIIKDEKKHADAYFYQGQAWEGMQQWSKAKKCYEHAIFIDKQYAASHVNRALINLRLAEFNEGWKGLEWRLQLSHFKPIDTPHPLWAGEDIINKTILVYAEQSDSDIILFSRFLSALAKCSKKIIVLCSEHFRLFFKSILCVDDVRLQAVPISNDAYDVVIPLMSLPDVLGVNTQEQLALKPLLQIPVEVVVPRLQTKKPINLGISWKNEVSEKQIFILEELLLLFSKFKGVLSVSSLEGSLTAEEIILLDKHGVKNLENDLFSISHTGALIKQLDIIICPDNSLVHLAGALDVKTLLTLNKQSNWYWMTDDNDCLWYSSVEILRGNKQVQATQISEYLSCL